MGIFRVEVEVARATDEPDYRGAGRLLVDTGSEMTWVAASVLELAGVVVRKPGQGFVTADGRTVVRDVGYALLRAEGFETVDEVVFAQDGDLELLGARTIEGFNAVVDAPARRLVAAGPIPAAGDERPGAEDPEAP